MAEPTTPPADFTPFTIQKPPFSYFETTGGKIHQFYISEEIGSAENYVQMIHCIRNASENDTVVLYLNTPGGSLYTGVQIINAIKTSPAKVVAAIDGLVASLGTLIFLAADEYMVHDNCMFMIHNYSGFTFGKGNEQAAQLAATMNWFNKLAADLYIPFLTEQELVNVVNGQDIWLDSDSVKERLVHMVKMRQDAQNKKARVSKKKKKAKVDQNT